MRKRNLNCRYPTPSEVITSVGITRILLLENETNDDAILQRVGHAINAKYDEGLKNGFFSNASDFASMLNVSASYAKRLLNTKYRTKYAAGMKFIDVVEIMEKLDIDVGHLVTRCDTTRAIASKILERMSETRSATLNQINGLYSGIGNIEVTLERLTNIDLSILSDTERFNYFLVGWPGTDDLSQPIAALDWLFVREYLTCFSDELIRASFAASTSENASLSQKARVLLSSMTVIRRILDAFSESKELNFETVAEKLHLEDTNTALLIFEGLGLQLSDFVETCILRPGKLVMLSPRLRQVAAEVLKNSGSPALLASCLQMND